MEPIEHSARSPEFLDFVATGRTSGDIVCASFDAVGNPKDHIGKAFARSVMSWRHSTHGRRASPLCQRACRALQTVIPVLASARRW